MTLMNRGKNHAYELEGYEDEDNDGVYYVDRKFRVNGPRGRGYGSRGRFPHRFNSRNDFQRNPYDYKQRDPPDKRYSDRSQKRCVICKRISCWSTKHPKEEQKTQFQQWITSSNNSLPLNDYSDYLRHHEGVETDAFALDEILSTLPNVDGAHFMSNKAACEVSLFMITQVRDHVLTSFDKYS